MNAQTSYKKRLSREYQGAYLYWDSKRTRKESQIKKFLRSREKNIYYLEIGRKKNLLSKSSPCTLWLSKSIYVPKNLSPKTLLFNYRRKDYIYIYNIYILIFLIFQQKKSCKLQFEETRVLGKQFGNNCPSGGIHSFFFTNLLFSQMKKSVQNLAIDVKEV